MSSMKKQRNTKERALDMAKRAVRQLSRISFNNMMGVPANINRHTGEPHKNARANARNLKNMQKNG
jgi:hypothetical protein